METMPERANRWKTNMFFLLSGQAMSIFGSRLSRFALGIWVFQKTASATEFALILLAASLPSLILTPFAGVHIDRLPRKGVLIACDIGAGIGSLALAIVLLFKSTPLAALYPIVFVSSFFDSVRHPTLSSTLALLVPTGYMTRANGLLASVDSIARILAPVSAGFLLPTIGLLGIVFIDVGSFLFGLVTLLAARLPELTTRSHHADCSVWQEALEGWRYIHTRHGLLTLLIFFAFINFNLGIFQALFTPHILSFSNEQTLGSIMSFGSVGMLCGSLLMMVYGGTRKKIHTVLLSALMMGTSIVCTGAGSSLTLITISVFVFLFAQPLLNAATIAIWQLKIEPHVQGRVFAINWMMVRCMEPLALVLAGPLVDKLVAPALRGHPALANLAHNQSTAIVFWLAGAAIILGTVLAFAYRPVRDLELIYPDFKEIGPQS